MVKYNNYDYIVDKDDHLRYIGMSSKPEQPKGLVNYIFMFADRKDLTTLDLSDWDMTFAESLYGMFYKCENLRSVYLPKCYNNNTITTMSHMFYGCKKINNNIIYRISELQCNKIVDTSYMFYDCYKINDISELKIIDFNNLDSAEGMFLGCDSELNAKHIDEFNLPCSANLHIMIKIVNNKGKYVNQIHKCRDNNSARIIEPAIITEDDIKTFQNKFTFYKILNNAPKKYKGVLGDFIYDTTEYELCLDSSYSEIGDRDYIKYIGRSNKPTQLVGCINYRYTFENRIEKSFDLSDWDMSEVVNTYRMFFNCNNLKDISSFKWDVSKLRNADKMFFMCNLKDISILSTWKPTSLEGMNNMFNCKRLKDISPIEKWGNYIPYTYQTDITGMFSGGRIKDASPMENWKLDMISDNGKIRVFGDSTELGYKRVGDQYRYIGKSTKPIQPLGITNYSHMFYNRWDLEFLDLSHWDMSKATNIEFMFADCNNMINLSSLKDWNTSNIKYANGVFLNCRNLKDISFVTNWNTGNFEKINSMFKNCNYLIDISPLKNWIVSKVININYIFDKCYYLKNFEPLKGWKFTLSEYITDEIIYNNIHIQPTDVIISCIGKYNERDIIIHNDLQKCIDIFNPTLSNIFNNLQKNGVGVINNPVYSNEDIETAFKSYYCKNVEENFENIITELSKNKKEDIHEKEKENMDKSYIQTLVDSGANLDGYCGQIPMPSKLSEDFDGDDEFDIEMEKDGTEIIQEDITTEDNNKLKVSYIKDYESELLGKIQYSDMEYLLDSYGNLRYIGESSKPTQPIGLKVYSKMFMDRKDLETLDLSDWDLSLVEVDDNMFGFIAAKIIGADELIISEEQMTNDDGIYEIRYNNMQFYINSDGFLRYIGSSTKPDQPIGLTSYAFMFADRKDLTNLDLSDWDMSEAEDIESMFEYCVSLKEIIGIESWDLKNVEFRNSMFNGMDKKISDKYYNIINSKKLSPNTSISKDELKVNPIESLSVNKGRKPETWDITSNDTVDNIIKSLLHNNINNFTLKINDDKSVNVTINQLKEK